MSLYEKLAQKNYSIANEVTPFDVEQMVASPFPYCHKSFETVGDTLLAIGFLIKKMALPKGGSILEFGPGWGNTSVELAKTGYQVTAVDIETNFIQLINQRAKKEGLSNLNAVHGDFFDIDTFEEKFDAVLFFESFHHCDNHNLLLEKIDRVLKPNGKVVFGAEPIMEDFPLPWGLRMDGQSIWAIRKNGWLELGFNRAYFNEALKRQNMVADYFDGKDGPWSSVVIAQRVTEAKTIFKFDSGRLKSHTGVFSQGGIGGTRKAGFLLFGPYVTASAGRFEFEVKLNSDRERPIDVTIDVVSHAGAKHYAKQATKIINSQNQYIVGFTLPEDVEDLEMRIYSANDTTGIVISSIILSRLL